MDNPEKLPTLFYYINNIKVCTLEILFQNPKLAFTKRLDLLSYPVILSYPVKQPV
jgi:hypothetical protein